MHIRPKARNNTSMVSKMRPMGHMEKPGNLRKTVRHRLAFRRTLSPSTPIALPMIPAPWIAASPYHAVHATPTILTIVSTNIHDDDAPRSATMVAAAPIRIMAAELIQPPIPPVSCPRLNNVTTTNGAAL
jgi:hypothetical protein